MVETRPTAVLGQERPLSSDWRAESWLKKRLRKRYEPENATGTHKAKLRAMERKDGQTLSSFADDVLELVRKSYPGVSLETQEILAKDRLSLIHI